MSTKEEHDDEILGMGPQEPEEINSNLPDVYIPADPERPF